MLGPNCIGVLNTNYQGVFTTPIPKLDPRGCDLVSSSGATAVFLLEAGMQMGLKFAGVYSVGNGAQVGVEDVRVEAGGLPRGEGVHPVADAVDGGRHHRDLVQPRIVRGRRQLGVLVEKAGVQISSA